MDRASQVNDMTWIEHLDELRWRLVKSAAAVALGMAVCGLAVDPIMAFLTQPVDKLYFMKPAEAFFIYFKVIFCCGIIAASPVVFYQFWAFLMPAFTAEEKQALLLYVPLSLFFFLGGLAFAWFIVLPQGLHFFLTFSQQSVQPLLSLESYLDFVLFLVLPFGLIFNLPLLTVLLAQAGLVTSRQMKKVRRYVIFAAFVIAAVITPTTDIISQSMLAVPILLLYEGSRFFIRYGLKK